MYEKAAGKANGEQQHEDNGGIIIDNEGVVLLSNANEQPVLVQDPQLPPLPPTTFNTMSSAMPTDPRYGYGSSVPTDGVALPNGLNLDKWVLCKMYEKAAGKANGEQQHEDNGGIIIDNEGVVLLSNANEQPVLVQDPQLPPLPPTTFNTMSSAMLTDPRYGYGSSVPTDGVALPNGLNVGYLLLLDDISDLYK
ncbi:unnamed protein product [Ilex paraguariensis]|uniref:Uncharacterized protein n=1 Tax=Ilex paraguariensis TaxID=185542 RepID=A0ABC8SEQ7_9AQUA